MKITIAKNAGFCPGVEFTIHQAKQQLKISPLYCLGEIVHNKQVIQDLEKMGMKTVTQIEEVPNGQKVIFRSHGEPLSTYQKAQQKGLQIQDLTCANVKVVHQKVQKAKQDSFILIIGIKNHPEIIGTAGFAGENYDVIETEDDILDAYIKYEKTNLGKIYVVSQTTFSSKKFDELAEEIEKNFCEAEVILDKTICNSTENRQLEALKMARENDVMLIIGGKNSSNTQKLFEISTQNCPSVYWIQTVEEVKNIEIHPHDQIGILAGASTPKESIEEVKNYLERKM